MVPAVGWGERGVGEGVPDGTVFSVPAGLLLTPSLWWVNWYPPEESAPRDVGELQERRGPAAALSRLLSLFSSKPWLTGQVQPSWAEASETFISPRLSENGLQGGEGEPPAGAGCPTAEGYSLCSTTLPVTRESTLQG